MGPSTAIYCGGSKSLAMSLQSADLSAAYMAKRPLAMCNQLTGCGKPEPALDEVIDSESV
jgi:hypothetical protein